MSTATLQAPNATPAGKNAVAGGPAVAGEEVLEDIEIEEFKRAPGPDTFYKTVFDDLEKAKSTPPKYSKEITILKKDGKTVDYVIKAGDPASDYKIYIIKPIENGAEVTDETKWKYIWARNTDQALSFYASNYFNSEPLESGKRGKAASIDPVYVDYLKMLITAGKMENVKTFLGELPQYTDVAVSNGYKV